MPIMSKLIAAYLAGLIDGDGSLEIFKRKKEECIGGKMLTARIRISLTDKNTIQWLKNSFGGWMSCEKREGNNKDCYEWCFANTKIKPLLERIYPYLRIKKKQAEILKKFLKTYKDAYKIVRNKNPLGYGTGYHKELKDEVRQTREKLFEEIRELNKKGKSWQSKRLSETTSKRGYDSLNSKKMNLERKVRRDFPAQKGSNIIGNLESEN